MSWLLNRERECVEINVRFRLLLLLCCVWGISGTVGSNMQKWMKVGHASFQDYWDLHLAACAPCVVCLVWGLEKSSFINENKWQCFSLLPQSQFTVKLLFCCSVLTLAGALLSNFDLAIPGYDMCLYTKWGHEDLAILVTAVLGYVYIWLG